MSEQNKVKSQAVSYRILIEETTTKQICYAENFVTSQKPTEIKAKTNSYSDPEILYEKTFVARDCVKEEVKTDVIFSQKIESADFDLPRVILAVNANRGGPI